MPEATATPGQRYQLAVLSVERLPERHRATNSRTLSTTAPTPVATAESSGSSLARTPSLDQLEAGEDGSTQEDLQRLHADGRTLLVAADGRGKVVSYVQGRSQERRLPSRSGGGDGQGSWRSELA